MSTEMWSNSLFGCFSDIGTCEQHAIIITCRYYIIYLQVATLSIRDLLRDH